MHNKNDKNTREKSKNQTLLMKRYKYDEIRFRAFHLNFDRHSEKSRRQSYALSGGVKTDLSFQSKVFA